MDTSITALDLQRFNRPDTVGQVQLTCNRCRALGSGDIKSNPRISVSILVAVVRNAKTGRLLDRCPQRLIDCRICIECLERNNHRLGHDSRHRGNTKIPCNAATDGAQKGQPNDHSQNDLQGALSSGWRGKLIRSVNRNTVTHRSPLFSSKQVNQDQFVDCRGSDRTKNSVLDSTCVRSRPHGDGFSVVTDRPASSDGLSTTFFTPN